MARILTRPMFRKGGLSQETGILSGLDSPRRSYAQGSDAPRVRYQPGFPGVVGGHQYPYGQTGSQIAADAASKVSKMSKVKNLLKSSKFSEKGLMELAKKYAPKALNVIKGGLSRFPLITSGVAGEYITRPRDVDKLVYEQEGYGPWEGRFRKILDPTYNKKWMKAAEEHYKDKDKVKDPEIPITDSDTDTQVTGDVESDLMRAYKEYAPIFEKELGVSPEDTKKQLWMQLAKFGAGVAAQPGGDLVGAIGKSAEKPLEGAGEVVKEVSTAKRQAKLLALQTAIKENEPGDIGKKLKDIAKAYNFTGKDRLQKAAAIFEKWNRNDSTARAQVNVRYTEQAKQLGLVHDNQNRFIAEANKLETDYPELIGQFNEKLPEDNDDWEIGYYVSDTGIFVRVVEQDGKKVTIGMDEPGFSDKKKTKK